MVNRSRLGFKVQRIHDSDHNGGGYRVLIDRLWPRGITKEVAALDEWAKEGAPSSELRRWYGHDPRRFEVFAQRYGVELSRLPGSDAVAHLLRLAREQRVILLTSTRDVEYSGALVLHDYLMDHHD